MTTLDRMRTFGRYRDGQELLHRRGMVISPETIRERCIKFGSLFAADLRHRESRRGSRWYVDEVCTRVDGVRYWLFLARAAPMTTLGRWRAVDEHGFVLDILLQRHRNMEAEKTFPTSLLCEYDFPEVIHTDQLRSRDPGDPEPG